MLAQHTQAMLDKDAENAMLRARCRQLEQDAVSMRDLMERHGLSPPPLPAPFFGSAGAVLPHEPGDTG